MTREGSLTLLNKKTHFKTTMKTQGFFLVVGGQMIWAKKYHLDIINVALMII